MQAKAAGPPAPAKAQKAPCKGEASKSTAVTESEVKKTQAATVKAPPPVRGGVDEPGQEFPELPPVERQSTPYVQMAYPPRGRGTTDPRGRGAAARARSRGAPATAASTRPGPSSIAQGARGPAPGPQPEVEELTCAHLGTGPVANLQRLGMPHLHSAQLRHTAHIFETWAQALDDKVQTEPPELALRLGISTLPTGSVTVLPEGTVFKHMAPCQAFGMGPVHKRYLDDESKTLLYLATKEPRRQNLSFASVRNVTEPSTVSAATVTGVTESAAPIQSQAQGTGPTLTFTQSVLGANPTVAVPTRPQLVLLPPGLPRPARPSTLMSAAGMDALLRLEEERRQRQGKKS